MPEAPPEQPSNAYAKKLSDYMSTASPRLSEKKPKTANGELKVISLYLTSQAIVLPVKLRDTTVM